MGEDLDEILADVLGERQQENPIVELAEMVFNVPEFAYLADMARCLHMTMQAQHEPEPEPDVSHQLGAMEFFANYLWKYGLAEENLTGQSSLELVLALGGMASVEYEAGQL